MPPPLFYCSGVVAGHSHGWLASRGRAHTVKVCVVDSRFRFTRKMNVFKHCGDWERSRPQGPKNAHNFLMTVRNIRWACDRVAEILLILINLFSTWLIEASLIYELPKKCATILYGHMIFTHLKLGLATATHNFKWVKITHICLIWNNHIMFKHTFHSY